MKSLISKIGALLFILITATTHSQQKTEKHQHTEALLNSREFVFNAERAVPLNSQSIILSSTYYLKVHKKTIESHLPYFGRAYSGMPYGGDSGIMFNTELSEYEMIKNKKNYEIRATVKDENDVYRLSLTIGLEGDASLSISSNKKSSISYLGTVTGIDKKEE